MPFQEQNDTSVECACKAVIVKVSATDTKHLRFFYKPITLTALAVALSALAWIATTQDVIEEGRDKSRMYVAYLFLFV
jgi:hypothetical protein